MVKSAKAYVRDEGSEKGVIVLVNFARDIRERHIRQQIDSIDLRSENKDRVTTDGELLRDVKEKRWKWTPACEKGKCR
jgi:hypothetical protein